MRISDIQKEELPLAVQFPGGQVLNIVYTPSTYTVAELEEIQRHERDIKRILRSVRRLLVRWDLENDQGPIPLQEPLVDGVPLSVFKETAEKTDPRLADLPDDPLRHVPTNIFMTIFRTVNEDQSPGK